MSTKIWAFWCPHNVYGYYFIKIAKITFYENLFEGKTNVIRCVGILEFNVCIRINGGPIQGVYLDFEQKQPFFILQYTNRLQQ